MNIDKLIDVMKALRDPQNGCPWDIKQDSKSIAPYTLGEAHEVLDAIERDDMENLEEELGDLLFNIVFHAHIANERGIFDFGDVVAGIVDKMIRRHPHVFEATSTDKLDEDTLKEQWQAHKKLEKTAQKKPASTRFGFGQSSAALSALNRAERLQHDAAEFGFDWPHIRPVIEKLEEEVAELKHAVETGTQSEISDELGDVLFVCLNIARHSKVNAEIALRDTNQKFMRRFEYVLEQMKSGGHPMNQKQLGRMESFWQRSKSIVG